MAAALLSSEANARVCILQIKNGRLHTRAAPNTMEKLLLHSAKAASHGAKERGV